MEINTILTGTINALSNTHVFDHAKHGEIIVPVKEERGTEASKEDIEKMVAVLNKAASSVDKRVSFEYNEKIDRLLVRVTDQRTDEVINQFPSKEMIRILEHINDMVGLFIDKRA